MSVLFGIISLPGAALMWLSQPLFRQILKGGEIRDADFVPVSVAFAVCCFITVGIITFIAVRGKNKVEEEKRDGLVSETVKRLSNVFTFNPTIA